jgi:diguanylate cyclase (GGDEF)-like protein
VDAPSNGAAEEPTVLVVDDEAWVRLFLQNILEDRGYHAVTVESADTGCTHLREEWVDLVLVDLTIDSMAGFDVISCAVQSRSHPAVLVMTGANRNEYAVRALDLGAFDFLAKPLDSERLHLTIQRALEHRRLKAEVSRLSADGNGAYQAHLPASSLAFYDSVTGLPNRSLFFDRLNQTILRRQRSKETVAVLIVTVDQLRQISVTYSEEEADQVLAGLARALEGIVRRHDTVARIGDNEFAIVVSLSSSENIYPLLQRIDVAAESLGSPEEHGHALRLNVGVAFYPSHATGAEALYHNALSALVTKERKPGGGYQIYEPELDAELRNKVETERRLATALRGREYLIELQPYHRLSDGEMHGAEALLRWRRSDGRMVSPATFIPLLEANRGIVSVTEWIVEELAATQQKLIDAGQRDQHLSFNVSPIHFERLADATELVSQIARTCPDPSRIVVELTESVFLGDEEIAATVIEHLASENILVALDDFGTGYSSLSYLTRYHVDYLKIDRSFVRNADTNPGAMTIIAAIISMAQQLGIVVIAEGAETKSEVDLLRSYGCDIVQGYIYSKPIAAPELITYAARHTSVTDELTTAQRQRGAHGRDTDRGHCSR